MLDKKFDTIYIKARELVDELGTLFINKAKAYGTEPITSFKWALLLPRMDSKKERLINITRRTIIDIGDETVFDTTADVLGYAIIWERLMKDEYALPFEGTIQAAKATRTYEELTWEYMGRVFHESWSLISQSDFSYREDIAILNVTGDVQTIVDMYRAVDLDNTKVNQEDLIVRLQSLQIQCFLYLLGLKGYYVLPKTRAKKDENIR